jgi:hypothetical protein
MSTTTERLSSHMSQSSWMMGGGRMDVQLDEGRGQRLGSRIQMSGRAFGLALSLDEVVSEYDPPRHKAWETVGEPRLLIIGQYRMGFDISPREGGSNLRVFIDYDLPHSRRSGWLTTKLAPGMPAGVRNAWCRTRRRISHPPLHRPPRWREASPQHRRLDFEPTWSLGRRVADEARWR